MPLTPPISVQLTLSSFCASSVLSNLSHPVLFLFFSIFFLMHYIAQVHVVNYTQYSQYLGITAGAHSALYMTIATEPFFGLVLGVCVWRAPHHFRGLRIPIVLPL